MFSPRQQPPVEVAVPAAEAAVPAAEAFESVAGSASTADTAYRPDPALMGTLVLIGDRWAVRMGEVPNFEWTSARPAKVPTPFQLRGPYYDTAKATLHRRGKGLTLKVTRKTPIPKFQEMLLQHLTDYGMRTITHLPDPRDPTTDSSMRC
jgi:hypothetical protein